MIKKKYIIYTACLKITNQKAKYMFQIKRRQDVEYNFCPCQLNMYNREVLEHFRDALILGKAITYKLSRYHSTNQKKMNMKHGCHISFGEKGLY